MAPLGKLALVLAAVLVPVNAAPAPKSVAGAELELELADRTRRLVSAGWSSRYYQFTQGSTTPSRSSLLARQPAVTRTDPELGFSSTVSPWAGLDFSDQFGRSDHFASYHVTYYVAPQTGQYTFSTSSDDGSMLYIDDATVVNNDGLHGMETETGTATLTAGRSYKIEVTFFERTGGAGLEVQVEGPGVSKRHLAGAPLPIAAAGQWLDLSGRPTMQSSTGWGGSAARAVDGNSNPNWAANSCTHTQKDSSPWWQVELGENTWVESVRVTNRDCSSCGDRLNGLEVTVDGQLCASGVTFNQGETKEITCTAPVAGANVRLEIPGRREHLTLCEVGVKAADPDISPVIKMVREDGSSVVAEAAAYWGADTFADRQAACLRLAQTDEIKALQTKARQTQSTLSLGVSQSATVLFFAMQLGMSAVVGPDGEFACVANTGLGFDLELLGGSVGVFAEMTPNEMGGWGNLGGALDGSTWCFSLGVSGAVGGVSFSWSMDKDVLHQDHLELQATLIAVFTQALEDSSGDSDLTLELLRATSLSLLRRLGVLSFGVEAVIGAGVLELPVPLSISAGTCAEHIIWCTPGHCDQTDGGVYDKRADMLTALPDNTFCDEMNGSCGYCQNEAGLGASGLTVCGGANNALLDAQEEVRDFAADTVVEVYETITEPINNINDWAASVPQCWPSGTSCVTAYGINTCQACCNGHNYDWFWQTSECK